jgi:hypothetical protein
MSLAGNGMGFGFMFGWNGFGVSKHASPNYNLPH